MPPCVATPSAWGAPGTAELDRTWLGLGLGLGLRLGLGLGYGLGIELGLG